MMERRFESGCAISGMVVTTRHGSWWWMGFYGVGGYDIDGERLCGGCRFFATLTVWVVAPQLDRVWTSLKVVATDRVWLTVEELGFCCLEKAKLTWQEGLGGQKIKKLFEKHLPFHQSINSVYFSF
ncbi:hypothetical protein VIGAN_06047500 [Vigna angularis var. angularis]|uniref:Uncharacterized protein n=1 Tax=Vigna angularis var. angularis TaxID=157739 RepID=A0A0S3S9F2_PHAAN|nr:hypothetical protein VIGAN_06047500 [Vigna angularis var. angularis]